MFLLTLFTLSFVVLLVALWAAPTPTARSRPAGRAEEDGLGTTLVLANVPSVILYEEEVKPPSVDMGDPIEMTNQFNTAWATKLPRILKEAGDVTVSAGYKPGTLSAIYAQLGTNQVITVWFRDGSSLCFFGYLKTFDPQGRKPKEKPMANLTIVVTNWDPVNDVEAGFVYTAAA